MAQRAFGTNPQPLPDGLTGSQFAVLEALWFGGEMCPGEVAQKILRSKGNITVVIDHLERDGLVARSRDTVDRRKTILSLTDRGREVIGAVFPRVAEALRREFAVLSASEQKQLGELCKKLGRGITSPIKEEPR